MSHLRRATSADAGAIARLHRKTVRECLPFLPELHSAEEDLQYFGGPFMAENEVWVGDDNGVSGYCGFREGWVAHLYVDSAHHGRGIGTTLLRKALENQTAVRLWVFQRNRPALEFYRRHGFTLVEETNGAGNEEREPDALYECLAVQT